MVYDVGVVLPLPESLKNNKQNIRPPFNPASFPKCPILSLPTSVPPVEALSAELSVNL
jgi:hypothetical protein